MILNTTRPAPHTRVRSLHPFLLPRPLAAPLPLPFAALRPPLLLSLPPVAVMVLAVVVAVVATVRLAAAGALCLLVAVVVAAVCGLAALSYRALPESAPSPPPPPAAAALGDGADASYYYAADRPPPTAQSALKQVDLVWRWLGWTASGAWLGSGPRPDRERGAGRRPGEDDGDLWAWASHNIGWLAGQLLHDALPPADTGHMATSRARSPREVRVAS